MSEVAVTNNEELIEKRRASWGQLGVDILERQMSLQARAQALILSIKHPEKFEDIPAAEALLKEIRQGQMAIEKDRKEITSRLDYVGEKLMDPEKTLNAPMKALYDDIVSMKKVKADIEQIKAAKEEEVRKFIETCKTRISNHDYECKSRISTDITRIYEEALNSGIPESKLTEYLEGEIKKFHLLDFECQKPVKFNVKHILPEEIDQLLEEHWRTNPYSYQNLFRSQLAEKFSDYAVALRNKEAALELSKKQAIEQAGLLKQQQENQETAIKLEANATPVMNTGPAVRPLKKSYEVDMPETLDNAFRILAAFNANRIICEKKTTVEKWFNFSASSAAKALAKVKNDDNDFQPEGINFKEVSKL